MSKTVTCTIERIAFGGSGIGHVDGKVCFVPFTAPGDRVRVRVTKEKKSYLEAELGELLSCSPQRVAPQCPVFGQCGGCGMQHLSYADQLAVKEEIFADHLERFARVERTLVAPLVSCDQPWGYRSRAQLKVRFIDGRILLGFYRPVSHYIVPLPQTCAIVNPAVIEAILSVARLLPSSPERERIPQIDGAVGEDGRLVVTVHFCGDNIDLMYDFLLLQKGALAGLDGLLLQSGRKETTRLVFGGDRLTYTLPAGLQPNMPELTLTFGAGGFSQVNFRQNQRLVEMTAQLACLSGNERVIDLFCGNGNLTIPLSFRSREILGVENYGPSIDDARCNAGSTVMRTNISFICADALEHVTYLADRGEQFDVVILDPPRTGAAQLMNELHRLRPRTIVYVSCNPASLARDLCLLARHHFRVKRSVPLDMFPQTSHIESVTLLVHE